MVKILIVDDSSHKIKNLRELIDKFPSVTYDIASDSVSAQKHLTSAAYDLLILDLNIPIRTGDDPSPDNGIKLLDNIQKISRIIKPFHIIGCTEYEDYKTKFYSNFDDDLWSIILYNPTSNAWQKQLKRKIEYLIQSKLDLQSDHRGYDYDLAIITALRHVELDNILDLDCNWQPLKINNDATEYYAGILKDEHKSLKVIASAPPQMGMVSSAVLTTKVISNFRPKYVVMGGIAAGLKSVGAGFGDLLVAESSFDYGSGKIETGDDKTTLFKPDFKHLPLETDLREAILSCITNKEFLSEIKRKWKGNKPSTELNVFLGPFGSGAGVIQNAKILEDIQGHNRKLIGIDMETYGVFYAAENCSKPRPRGIISIKGLTDYADDKKNDEFQNYAGFTSARFIEYFALNKMNFDI